MQDKNQRIYIAIDLKSFYASVECVERGLNPLTTNLVVADSSRTEKTICLAVTPSLKSYGIPGRARLFEVVQKVEEVNRKRLNDYKRNSGNKKAKFSGKTFDDVKLKSHPEFAVDYLVAPPRMAFYMQYSTRIYEIYLKYVSPEDIHVYSIDEVFIDVTGYLSIYGMTARELAMTIIRDVLEQTGITATAGIGTNLYLAKVAMDIVAKHIPADKDGVRIAYLDEKLYREQLWSHQPLTDFWRVGKGYAKKLNAMGLYTMGDIAEFSIKYEDYLYKLFGVNAELLIDHAWGYEPCTIADVKSYKPETSSLSSGQVLQKPYNYQDTRLIVKEMTDLLVLDLVEKALVTNQLTITVCYDIENLTNPEIRKEYKGEIKTDGYGRKIPKHSHGTIRLEKYTSSTKEIVNSALKLFDRIVNPKLLIRKIYVVACGVIPESEIPKEENAVQLDFFTDYAKEEQKEKEEQNFLKREKKQQRAILDIKKKYGKNSIVKGMDLRPNATTILRNNQVGGHKA